MISEQKTTPRLLKLVPYDHPILREPTETVHFPLSAEDQAIIRDMKYSIQKEQLKKAEAPWEAAVGMAANQWGINKRIFLFCPEGDSVNGLEVIINPQYKPLTTSTPKNTAPPQDQCWEGCFSVPLATGNIQRYTHIQVTYQDESGKTMVRDLKDWPARVWQHENDHLNGFLYDDPRTGRCLEKHIFDSKEAVDEFYSKKKEQAIQEGKRPKTKIALAQSPCPCGSSQNYAACCGLYLDKIGTAPTPETLMRSRYTAYVAQNMAYIKATMRGPALAAFDQKIAKMGHKNSGPKWLGLKVIKAYLDPKNSKIGYVEFVARYLEKGIEVRLHELSEFHEDNGRWYYVNGKFIHH